MMMGRLCPQRKGDAMAEMILRFEGGVSPPVMSASAFGAARQYAEQAGLEALSRFLEGLVILDREQLEAVRQDLSRELPEEAPKGIWGGLPEALAPQDLAPPIELFLDDPEDGNYVPPFPTTYNFELPDDPVEAAQWEREREQLEANPPDDWPYLTQNEFADFVIYEMLPERLRRFYGDRYPQFFQGEGEQSK